MDDWEIDDEAMAKYMEDFEAQNRVEMESDVGDDVEFVPETQFDQIPPKLESGTSSLNARLRQVVANRTPGKEICYEGNTLEPLHPIGCTLPAGPYPICRCGVECVVVVAKTEANAGRRFYGCALFEDFKYTPGVGKCCKFMQWIDPPMCDRGRQYALEMQAENRRLNKVIEEQNRSGWGRGYR